MFLTARFAFELGFVKVNIIKIDANVTVLAIYYQSILDGSLILNMERQSKPGSTTFHSTDQKGYSIEIIQSKKIVNLAISYPFAANLCDSF